jgi:hypothetical protein
LIISSSAAEFTLKSWANCYVVDAMYSSSTEGSPASGGRGVLPSSCLRCRMTAMAGLSSARAASFASWAAAGRERVQQGRRGDAEMAALGVVDEILVGLVSSGPVQLVELTDGASGLVPFVPRLALIRPGLRPRLDHDGRCRVEVPEPILAVRRELVPVTNATRERSGPPRWASRRLRSRRRWPRPASFSPCGV